MEPEGSIQCTHKATANKISGNKKKELDQQAHIASGSTGTTTKKKKKTAYLCKHINCTSLELHLKTRSCSSDSQAFINVHL